MATEVAPVVKPAYTITLFVSKRQPAHTTKVGYDERTFPAQTTELARIELGGEDLEGLLSDVKETIDIVGMRNNG